MVLGCKQTYEIDYAETFVLVVKFTTVRTLLVAAAIQDWVTVQMDVSNAFLHGDFDEEVYMKFSQEYTGLGSRSSACSVNNLSITDLQLVCKLIKPLYGLRQTPR